MSQRNMPSQTDSGLFRLEQDSLHRVAHGMKASNEQLAKMCALCLR